jgi:hypothetical protein
MRLYEVLARFSDIIRSYAVVQYEIADLNSRLKLKIVFANGTELYVRDILLDGRRREYAFHWQEGSGRLIARWDNAAHWPEIETFPRFHLLEHPAVELWRWPIQLRDTRRR